MVRPSGQGHDHAGRVLIRVRRVLDVAGYDVAARREDVHIDLNLEEIIESVRVKIERIIRVGRREDDRALLELARDVGVRHVRRGIDESPTAVRVVELDIGPVWTVDSRLPDGLSIKPDPDRRAGIEREVRSIGGDERKSGRIVQHHVELETSRHRHLKRDQDDQMVKEPVPVRVVAEVANRRANGGGSRPRERRKGDEHHDECQDGRRRSRQACSQ